MAEGYAKGTIFGKPRDEVVKKPGAIHKELGIPVSKKIPEKTLSRAASAGGKLGKRARLAETFRSMKHG